MKVFVTNQPYMLYETVEVLRRYVNGDTPEDLSTEEPFCLSPQETGELVASACQGLDPNETWISYFFQNHPILDSLNQSTSLASCIAYSNFNIRMQETTLDEQLAFVVDQWNTVRRNGYQFCWINRFGLGIEGNTTQTPIRLAEELKKLPITSDFYLLLHEAFSDLEFSVQQLARVIRPVAERLEVLLQPYVQRSAALAERWQLFFQDRAMLNDFLLRRIGRIAEESFDQMYLVLRYLGSRYALGTYSEEERIVGFHMGVGVKLTLSNAYEEKDWNPDRELTAFKLLGDKSRRDIIRLIHKNAMTIQEISNHLGMNSGTVFRNINALCNAELLIQERRGERPCYRARLPYIQAILYHMMEYLQGDDLPTACPNPPSS